MAIKRAVRWLLVLAWLYLIVYLCRQNGADSAKVSEWITQRTSSSLKLFGFDINYSERQAMHPIVEELSDNYKVVAVDIDDQEELAEQYEVSGIPCFVVFKDGEEIDRRVGMQSKKRLIKMLEQ